MIWGNIKTKQFSSKGNYPIFRSWTQQEPTVEYIHKLMPNYLYDMDVYQRMLKEMKEKNIPYIESQHPVDNPSGGDPLFIKTYVHRINDEEFMIFFLDITAEKHVEDELRSLAFVDSLSSLLTRRAMNAELEIIANSIKDEHWYVMMIDVDDFKKINDSYGHDIGDTVLMNIAQLLIENLPTGLVSRWGGEEFLITMIGENELEVKKKMEHVLQLIAEQTIVINDQKKFNVTVSCGIAELHKGEKYKEAVIRADHAMYSVKSSGKNGVKFFEKK